MVVFTPLLIYLLSYHYICTYLISWRLCFVYKSPTSQRQLTDTLDSRRTGYLVRLFVIDILLCVLATVFPSNQSRDILLCKAPAARRTWDPLSY